MARDAVAIQSLTRDAGTLVSAATTIGSTNDGTIAAGGDTQKLLILAANASGGGLDITFLAGDGPSPAFQSEVGDLVQEIANNTERAFVIDSARFAQSDGAINFDVEGNLGIQVFRLP